MKKITFFGSGVELEDNKNPTPEADSIAKVLAKNYSDLLFGGTDIGLMGLFARCCKENNMDVTCVVHKWFVDNHGELLFKEGSLVTTTDLAERKKVLCETDAIICYPGGIGTFDELFYLLARISHHEVEPIPILIYNFERFFAPLLLQIEHGIRTGIIKKEMMEYVHTFEHVDQLTEIMKQIK